MLKRSVFWMLAGAVLAGLLLLVPVAAADNCMGHCGDLDGYTYVGCSFHMDENGRVDVVACGYTQDPLPPEVIRLLNELMHIN